MQLSEIHFPKSAAQFQFQFLRGPSTTLTPPPSRRTAPLPSVNTSTEYSLEEQS